MSQEIFEENITELVEVVDMCFDNGFIIPGLVIIYVGIDIMAWLNRPESRENVIRDDFISWVDEFLLPNSNLACNAIDLYAARCGLVHTYSAESRLSRGKHVRKIYYGSKNGDSDHFSPKVESGKVGMVLNFMILIEKSI